MSFNINNGIPESDLPVKSPSGAARVRYVDGDGKSYSSAMPDVIAASALVQDAIAGVVADAEEDIGVIVNGMGYLPPVAFASGLNVDSSRFTVTSGGVTYAPVADATPFTTTGTFNPAQWRVVQGVTAADLGAANGSALVGFKQKGVGAVLRPMQNKAREIVTPEDFGAAGDGVVDDSAAIQMAIDYIAALGRGIVKFTSQNYIAKGLVQKSGVCLDLGGARITSPDGLAPSVIRSWRGITSGTTSAGSSVVTVADASGIRTGCLIAVRGAGGLSPVQSTTLASSVSAAQTAGITLTSTAGFANSGLLQVGSELIAYTGRSGAQLTGVTRGVYGTSAADHASGAVIGVSMRLIGEVRSRTGNSVEIHVPAALAVSSAVVDIGPVDMEITGGQIDGRRVLGGSGANVYAVEWALTRYSKIDTEVFHADAAVQLSQGSRDNVVAGSAHDCGLPEALQGSAYWGFQQCTRNHWKISLIDGPLWVGVYLDNRTSLATEWDGSCDNNVIDVGSINAKPETPWILNSGVQIIGGDGNVVRLGSIRGVRTPFVLGVSSGQVHTHDGSLPSTTRNRIGPCAAEVVYQPLVVESGANGNVFDSITWTATTMPPVDHGTGNVRLFCSPNAGGPATSKIEMAGGTQSAPGISFAGDTNTGFYPLGTGDWQWVSGSQLVFRMRSNGVQLRAGKILDFDGAGGGIGAGSSSRFGFWGKTGQTQPAAIPNATDAPSAVTQLNALLAALRTIGIIST